MEGCFIRIKQGDPMDESTYYPIYVMYGSMASGGHRELTLVCHDRFEDSNFFRYSPRSIGEAPCGRTQEQHNRILSFNNRGKKNAR